jgi:hypothetical protein
MTDADRRQLCTDSKESTMKTPGTTVTSCARPYDRPPWQSRRDGQIVSRLACGLTALGLLLVQSSACETAPPSTQEKTVSTEIIKDSLGNPLHEVTSRMVSLNLATANRMNLLARIEVQPNEIIEFYEPIPGAILITGGGAPAGAPIFTRETVKAKDVESLWKIATKNVNAPLVLTDAIGRARGLQSAAGNPIARAIGQSSPSGGGVIQAPSGFGGIPQPEPDGFGTQSIQPDKGGEIRGGANWCSVDYYSSGYGNCVCHDECDCVDDWTGGRQKGTIGGPVCCDAFGCGWTCRFSYFINNVCPRSGSVVLHDKLYNGDGTYDFSWNVSQDMLRWVEWYKPGHWFEATAYVEQAENATFNFRMDAELADGYTLF